MLLTNDLTVLKSAKYHNFFFQVTSGFELYATFNPLVTKPIAINAINKLLKWITVRKVTTTLDSVRIFYKYVMFLKDYYVTLSYCGRLSTLFCQKLKMMSKSASFSSISVRIG